jgi:hypothetical protein
VPIEIAPQSSHLNAGWLNKVAMPLFRIRNVVQDQIVEPFAVHEGKFKKLFFGLYYKKKELVLKEVLKPRITIYGFFNSASAASLVPHDMKRWKVDEGKPGSSHLPDFLNVEVCCILNGIFSATDMYGCKRKIEIPLEDMAVANFIFSYLMAPGQCEYIEINLK